jgi:hypothetical protein
MNTTYKSVAVGEQNHGVKTCLIIFDKAHKLDSKTDNDNVFSKSATEMTVMMHNTATLESAYSLRATVYAEMKKRFLQRNTMTMTKPRWLTTWKRT